MTKYKAVLFAPDGDWVTDYRESDTVDEVWQRLADQGSRWIFYPFGAVIVDHGGSTSGSQRIVDTCWPLKGIKGLAIKTVKRELAKLTDEQREALFFA
jgi:hypothetical protein